MWRSWGGRTVDLAYATDAAHQWQPSVAPPIQDGVSQPDDLSREVYCLLGLPIDGVDMATAVKRLRAAAAAAVPFLLSTVNVHFLVRSLTDAQFRDSVLSSELSTADGLPLVWLARFLALPIPERVAGSDLLDVLAVNGRAFPTINMYLFGGDHGIAAKAALNINRQGGCVRCVGAMSPGFGTLDELSAEDILQAINASDAQFLVVSLGAVKGQAWLLRNRDRIHVPVRAHLGAALNFQAGALRRAPAAWRRLGIEWVWRITQEPQLWRRYLTDGMGLTRIFMTRALPLAVLLRSFSNHPQLAVERQQSELSTTVVLSGAAVARHIPGSLPALRSAIDNAKGPVLVDISRVCAMDLRFLGLLLMAAKQLSRQGCELKIFGASRRLALLFRLNGLGNMLVQRRG